MDGRATLAMTAEMDGRAALATTKLRNPVLAMTLTPD